MTSQPPFLPVLPVLRCPPLSSPVLPAAGACRARDISAVSDVFPYLVNWTVIKTVKAGGCDGYWVIMLHLLSCPSTPSTHSEVTYIHFLFILSMWHNPFARFDLKLLFICVVCLFQTTKITLYRLGYFHADDCLEGLGAIFYLDPPQSREWLSSGTRRLESSLPGGSIAYANVSGCGHVTG